MGSRGDVQPMVALAVELSAAGHEVRVAAQAGFAGLVTGAGPRFEELSGDLRTLLGEPRVARAMLEGDHLRFLWAVRRSSIEVGDRWAREGLRLAEGAELVISGGVGLPLAASVAERAGAALVQVYLQPGAWVPELPIRPQWAVNRAFHLASPLLHWFACGAAVNRRIRPELGLRRYPWFGPQYRLWRDRVPVLFAFSPLVLGPDGPLPRWAAQTGFWFLEGNGGWTPPAELLAFLEAGPPPVYVGFGSMPDLRPEATRDVIVAAVRRSGRRAVIAAGWGASPDGTADDGRILTIDQAPHDWLFDRVSSAVHHCGAGTTAAAARAGIPSVPVPVFGEQDLWAGRLHRTGAATAPIPRAELTVDALAAALDQAAGPDLYKAADQLGARIRAEAGTAGAVTALRRWNLLP